MAKVHPFFEDGAEVKLCFYVFYKGQISDDDYAAFTQLVPETEYIEKKEGVLYLHYKAGCARAKLSVAFIERKLKIVATARNWNTSQKLLTLLQERL
mgnify:CR=1 FL=1